MLPAISLVATPGRRRATLEVAQEIERRGFAGVYVPSFLDGLGLCEALALTTTTLRFGTSIANIYTRHPSEYAATAALIHELSGGRFHFGIGVSHGPVHEFLSVTPGKPLQDIRRFVEHLAAARTTGGTGFGGPGEMPPLVLATLRERMVTLASEIAQGVVWANGARSHMPASLAHLRPEQQQGEDFFIGNMIPTCISDDRETAKALLRRTLIGYVRLPNYRNYWSEAGYADEMDAMRTAIAEGKEHRLPDLMRDPWLADVTLHGSPAEVREGVQAWYAAGVKTPILVPSSTNGGQFTAIEEVFAAFA
jgi:alkanesulfonate monooxygenase SsuD/methylene tetrahydromethanopterin reductase-like flavin-dependent oxidoreductase (luciferase family)